MPTTFPDKGVWSFLDQKDTHATAPFRPDFTAEDARRAMSAILETEWQVVLHAEITVVVVRG